MDYFQYLERTAVSSIDLNLTPFSSCLALHQESERINKQDSKGRHGNRSSDGLTSPPHWAAASGKGKAAPRKNRGGAQGRMTGRGLADLQRKPKHPTAKNKLFIHDPSNLRIKHVNSKTVAFRQDLRIRSL
jgi:hypothetical protein